MVAKLVPILLILGAALFCGKITPDLGKYIIKVKCNECGEEIIINQN